MFWFSVGFLNVTRQQEELEATGHGITDITATAPQNFNCTTEQIAKTGLTHPRDGFVTPFVIKQFSSSLSLENPAQTWNTVKDLAERARIPY